MSEFAQAALVMARGYGRRAFDRGAVTMPLLMVAGFGFGYLRAAPTGTPTSSCTRWRSPSASSSVAWPPWGLA